jgi:hypothetical protein
MEGGMKRWVGPVWMAGGAILGALVALLAIGSLALPFGLGRSTLLMDRLPTPLLGRLLLGPASPRFISDSRVRYPLRAGVAFYAAPVWERHILCRVPVHFVSSDYFQGKATGPDAVWVTQKYGLEDTAGSHCSKFRDIEHLFEYVGSGSPQEPVLALEAASRAARDGPLDFDVDCEQRSGACDPLAVLRSLDVRDIGWIEAVRWETVADVVLMTHRHNIFLGGDRTRPPNLEVTVRSRLAEGEGIPVVQEVHIKSLGVPLDPPG